MPSVPVVMAAAPGGARWRAAGWDYLVIVGWLAVVTVLGFGVRAVAGLSGVPSPGVTDAVAFGCTVLPVWVGLTAAEAGCWRAGLGKRRVGLRVVTAVGCPPSLARVAVRNAVKLLPWQLAHLAVVRLALGVDPRGVVGVAYALALVLPVASVVLAWRDPTRRALHDLAAGTRVVADSPAASG